MKINSRRPKTNPGAGGKARGAGRSKDPDRGVAGLKQTSFLDTLNEEKRDRLKEEIGDMVERMDEKGEALSRHPSMESLKAYRDVLSRIIALITENRYCLMRDRGSGGDGRYRLFQTVRQIDDSLEQLSSLLLGGEASRLDVLARLDAIRGLVLDLYM